MARSKVLVSLSMRHGVCESIVAIQMRANEHALTFVPPTSLWENASQADASRIHVGMIRKGYAAETLKEQEKRATMQNTGIARRKGRRWLLWYLAPPRLCPKRKVLATCAISQSMIFHCITSSSAAQERSSSKQFQSSGIVSGRTSCLLKSIA